MTVDELSREDPRAYVRLAALVRDEIAAGRLKPGQPVPSITVLGQRFGHARPTGGKALRLLTDQGVLYRVPGVGYHVCKDALRHLSR